MASASPFPAAPEPIEPTETIEQRLRSLLEARCRILLATARPETLDSDAPELVRAVLESKDGLVRQPPFAAQRALSVVRDPASGLADIAVLFEQDPALTRSLFRVANSVKFSTGGEPCLSIGHALQRVGHGTLEGVILSEMARGLLCRPGSSYVALLDQVWTHMTRTGDLSRRLGWVFQVDPDAAFTMGLLHDLGKLVIIDLLSELRARTRRDVVLPAAFLDTLLNRLHEPIGGIAVHRWGLGETAALAIAGHHRQPPPETPDRYSELLHLAECVDHAVDQQIRLDLPRLWREAEFTADIAAVQTVLEDIPGLILHGSGSRAPSAPGDSGRLAA